MVKNILRKNKILITSSCICLFLFCNIQIIRQYLNFSIDLTQEKRNSLHPITKKILKKVNDKINIKIYLAGNLPTGPKKLQLEIKALLNNFKKINSKIHVQWINLDDFKSKDKKKIIQKLQSKGIQPSHISTTRKGKRIEKTVFPGAILTYKQQSTGILLIQSQNMMSTHQMLKQSINNLEYNFVLGIKDLISKKKRIALLQSHSHIKKKQLLALLHTLSPYYQIEWVDRFPNKNNLFHYDAIMIIKPQKYFIQKEKYALDQYIMQGGKVLFFIDRVNIDMDKFFRGEKFAIPIDLGLDDLFFQYGLRINYNLIQDAQAGVYPIVVGNIGNQSKIQLLNFPFFPILNSFSSHKIVQKLSPLYTQFVSSIDEIKTPRIQKIPLIYTSPYTKILGLPMHIDLENLRKGTPDIKIYNQGKKAVAYLLEGIFSSLYTYQPIPEKKKADHLDYSTKNTLLVVSSGNMLINQVHPQSQQPVLPLGYDLFLKQTFAQGKFILNTFAYMLQEESLIQIKDKKINLRMLNPIKVEQESFFWKLMNIFLPVLFLIIFGIIWYSIYTRKYR